MNKIPISALIHQHPERKKNAEPQRLELFGRDYYTWENWVYPFPYDDAQGELWDVIHTLIYEAALYDQLHTMPLRYGSPLQILDVGCGTGRWCQDMAVRYPNFKIVGIDLVPFDIRDCFDNISNIFPVDFMKQEWPLALDSQDLVHLALLCGSVPDWQKLYQTAFKYIKPITGHIEHIEIDWQPRSHPAPFPLEAELLEHWWESLQEASSRTGFPMACPSTQRTEEYLENAGFVDITRRKIRIPFHGAKEDDSEWSRGHHYKAATISEGPVDKSALASLSMLHLVREFGYSGDEVRDMARQLRPAVNKKSTPLYNYLHVWTARKPFIRATNCCGSRDP